MSEDPSSYFWSLIENSSQCALTPDRWLAAARAPIRCRDAWAGEGSRDADGWHAGLRAT